MSTEEAQLPERLTLEEAGQTLAELGAIVARQPGPTVSVDAAGLREFDSSAVAVLLELRRQLIARASRCGWFAGLGACRRWWPCTVCRNCCPPEAVLSPGS